MIAIDRVGLGVFKIEIEEIAADAEGGEVKLAVLDPEAFHEDLRELELEVAGGGLNDDLADIDVFDFEELVRGLLALATTCFGLALGALKA